MQELEDEKQVEENKKKKKHKKKGKHKVDVDGAGIACGAAGGAATGHAAGAAAREQAGMTALGDGTAHTVGKDVGGSLSCGLVEADYNRDGANMKTQQGRAKRDARGRGDRGQGAAGVSVAGDLEGGGSAEHAQPGGAKKGGREGGRGMGGKWQGAAAVAGDLEGAGAAAHATVALGGEMTELVLAPGASNVGAQGIRHAESLFLAKFQAQWWTLKPLLQQLALVIVHALLGRVVMTFIIMIPVRWGLE